MLKLFVYYENFHFIFYFKIKKKQFFIMIQRICRYILFILHKHLISLTLGKVINILLTVIP